jgi:hypothetical protein
MILIRGVTRGCRTPPPSSKRREGKKKSFERVKYPLLSTGIADIQKVGAKLMISGRIRTLGSQSDFNLISTFNFAHNYAKKFREWLIFRG